LARNRGQSGRSYADVGIHRPGVGPFAHYRAAGADVVLIGEALVTNRMQRAMAAAVGATEHIIETD